MTIETAGMTGPEMLVDFADSFAEMMEMGAAGDDWRQIWREIAQAAEISDAFDGLDDADRRAVATAAIMDAGYCDDTSKLDRRVKALRAGDRELSRHVHDPAGVAEALAHVGAIIFGEMKRE